MTKILAGTIDAETIAKLDAWRKKNFNLSYGEIVRQGVALFVEKYIDKSTEKTNFEIDLSSLGLDKLVNPYLCPDCHLDFRSGGCRRPCKYTE